MTESSRTNSQQLITIDCESCAPGISNVPILRPPLTLLRKFGVGWESGRPKSPAPSGLAGVPGGNQTSDPCFTVHRVMLAENCRGSACQMGRKSQGYQHSRQAHIERRCGPVINPNGDSGIPDNRATGSASTYPAAATALRPFAVARLHQGVLGTDERSRGAVQVVGSCNPAGEQEDETPKWSCGNLHQSSSDGYRLPIGRARLQ